MIELKPEAPYVIVSVVSPQTDDPSTSGRITNYPCAPTVSHPVLERSGSTWIVRAAAMNLGYTLIQSLYAQERFTEGAARWEKFIADSQAGKRVGAFPREFLPKEVLRRQACGELDEAQALADAKRTAPVTAKVAK